MKLSPLVSWIQCPKCRKETPAKSLVNEQRLQRMIEDPGMVL